MYAPPGMVPGFPEHRIHMGLTIDFIFVCSFFVLGGDFWHKLRALFFHTAKPHQKSKNLNPGRFASSSEFLIQCGKWHPEPQREFKVHCVVNGQFMLISYRQNCIQHPGEILIIT